MTGELRVGGRIENEMTVWKEGAAGLLLAEKQNEEERNAKQTNGNLGIRDRVVNIVHTRVFYPSGWLFRKQSLTDTVKTPRYTSLVSFTYG